MKTWVKLYTEILQDPDQGTLTLAQRGIWSLFLALAGQLDDRDEDDNETGRLDTPDRVAWHLRCGVSEVEDAVAAFVERGMVHRGEDGALYLVHYADRQRRYQEDKEAIRARVARHRSKQRSPIFERDNWTCRYCGKKLGLDECTIDHLVPVSKGGREDDDNLVTSCPFCNASKGARTLEQARMVLRPVPLRNGATGYVTAPEEEAESDSEGDPESEADSEGEAEADPARVARAEATPATAPPGSLMALIERTFDPDAVNAETFNVLVDMVGAHGEARLRDAIQQMDLHAPEKRGWAYVRGVLRRWAEEDAIMAPDPPPEKQLKAEGVTGQSLRLSVVRSPRRAPRLPVL